MNTFHHTIQQRNITFQWRKTAKKNIILRVMNQESIKVSTPKGLSYPRLLAWLNEHESRIHQLLQHATPTTDPNTLPTHICLMGKPLSIQACPHTQTIHHDEHHLWIPMLPITKQKQLISQFLRQLAQTHLLNKLQHHAQHLQLFPQTIALSSATTFWGICRPRTGIRLNWRLIGAPEWVQDYVCIHELCHLIHPNHSPDFWAAVNQHTTHTQHAKTWLKQHGKTLFSLG